MIAWRKCLLPLVPLYAAALAKKNANFDRGEAAPSRLAWPVVSVGGVSAGGAGKTPFTMMLAGMLMDREIGVDVLSRGYRRTGRDAERVDPAGSAARYGDEPLLIAQRTGAPVYVGAERYEAGLLAERDSSSESGRFGRVHLLDAGFQHRRLARAVDIVLVTRRDLDDHLLPAGNLREPLSSLSRAQIVVLRDEEASVVEERVLSALNGALPMIWKIRRSASLHPMTSPQGARRDAAVESARKTPLHPLAFCGLARPEGFADSLQAAGCSVAGFDVFRDHHAYTLQDMERLVRRARAAGADGFVTTEKDAVKLTPAMLASLDTLGPVHVARLSVELMDAEAAMRELIAMLSESFGQAM